jgi:hypothetical protein
MPSQEGIFSWLTWLFRQTASVFLELSHPGGVSPERAAAAALPQRFVAFADFLQQSRLKRRFKRLIFYADV